MIRKIINKAVSYILIGCCACVIIILLPVFAPFSLYSYLRMRGK